MKKLYDTSLVKELKAAGAKQIELDELVAVAHQLKHLDSSTGRHMRMFWWVTSVSIGALMAGLVFISALQSTVLPGTWLYPVQKTTDQLISAVDPQYRGTVMLLRAQQTDRLVIQRANPELVLATLADYRAEALAYGYIPAHYATFETCKAWLLRARIHASDPEKATIDWTMRSLDTI